MAGISKEIAVKNCTILFKSRLAELEEFLMIQLSQATADFLTRKIIQYFSRAARGYVAGRGTSKKGEKNARLFQTQELEAKRGAKILRGV